MIAAITVDVPVAVVVVEEGSAAELDPLTYKRTVLGGGVRIVTEKMPYVRSVSLGIWVDVGSRNEASAVNGISHFIEHMVFKGTKKRSALEIAQSLESLGGVLNAFTTRENTCYYVRVLDEHFDVAMDVLADILTDSLFDPEELERERMVILEEIKDLFDTPSEVVHDHFAEILWNSHPLGQSILGTPESMSGISRATILEYLKHNYTTDRVVVAASGNIDHEKLVDLVRERFGFETPNTDHSLRTPSYGGGVRKTVPRDSAQTHICLGLPTFSFADDRKHALLLVNSILGGGMGSRLFQSLREKQGLAYTIYTMQDFYHDTGILSTYLGTESTKVVRAIESILKELADIKANSVTDDEVAAAKSQLRGNLLLSLESTYNRMSRLARHELFLRGFSTVEQTVADIDAVSAGDIRDLVDDILDPDKVAMIALGPVTDAIISEIDWSILR
jgi:predicted Zn-dependent peptidase